jgi:hypothetical protein
MDPVAYSERQYFRQDWLWALLLVSSVPAAIVVVAVLHDSGGLTTDAAFWIVAVLSLVFGPIVAFYYARLEVSVDEDGLALRLWPLQLRQRLVPCTDIEAVRTVDISPMGDFGGVGVRYDLSVYRWGVRIGEPVGYVVSGDRGVRIDRTNGRDLVVTTEDPRALAAALDRACT